jgi:hypothetical protein
MLWVSVLLGCDPASLSDRFTAFTNNVVGLRPVSYVETLGIQLPIDDATNGERKPQLHRFENLKSRMKTVFWDVRQCRLVVRYQRFRVTWGVRVGANVRTVTLTLLSFPLTRTSRQRNTGPLDAEYLPAWTPSISMLVKAPQHFPVTNQSNVAQKQAKKDSETTDICVQHFAH